MRRIGLGPLPCGAVGSTPVQSFVEVSVAILVPELELGPVTALNWNGIRLECLPIRSRSLRIEWKVCILPAAIDSVISRYLETHSGITGNWRSMKLIREPFKEYADTPPGESRLNMKEPRELTGDPNVCTAAFPFSIRLRL